MLLMRLSLISLLLLNKLVYAASSIASQFPNQTVCLILFNANKQKILIEDDPARCKIRIPADSTFKIPLSLMSFNEKLIDQNTLFKWDGKHRELEQWNQNQTSKTWLSNSAVWVSQQLTQQLGLIKIQKYLRQFNYGNQDFSGDKGLNNGLTHAWLTSSLKISGEEQFDFLRRMLALQLPIKISATKNTMENLYIETSQHGFRLYGKTGSSSKKSNILQDEGWFIGWVQHNKQKYIFVFNFIDKKDLHENESAGLRAKKYVKQLLVQQGLWD